MMERSAKGPISRYLELTGESHVQFLQDAQKGDQNAVTIFAAEAVYDGLQDLMYYMETGLMKRPSE